ncbi:class I SAM-dependent methyltransferase [Abyssisolibacter fermentans]|uniref:class I SAM-dependent methyltransferase n=1 Tax=Abyssisolibacter fermentans TaxID=1766203 RepID=UPI00082F6AEE|nr:class I SAM-dependent methyltransferase [Abyssisolibacter fermentans]
MAEFYSKPNIYDITFTPRFNEALKKHYKRVLDKKSIKTIHDCSFGTGNLTLVLKEMGYEISGSDISQEMLKEASTKINKNGWDINLTQCDFRDLDSKINDKFDCVMSTGNSLGHVPNDDVIVTLRAMNKLVKDDGYIYIDTRNWDNILENKQRFYFYPPYFKDDKRINLIQVWDYNEDNSVDFNILYSFEKDNKIIKREEFKLKYYPLKRDFIYDELTKLGYKEITIYNFLDHKITKFEEMEWYCIIAKKEVK